VPKFKHLQVAQSPTSTIPQTHSVAHRKNLRASPALSHHRRLRFLIV
jgi:hypothetical protein